MNTTLSIVVPVYNVEKYLRQNLDTLLNQSYKNLEIIAVNDGSTDSSLAILNEYEEKYRDKLIIINQENGGLSKARNKGVLEASGDYIAFVDSDDFVNLEMYLDMIKVAEKEESDIVVCDIEYFWNDNDTRNYVMPGLTNRFKTDNTHKQALLSSLGVWNKIFSKRFFDKQNISFHEGTLYEDIEVITYLFAKADKISYIPKALLYYRQRENSIMTTRSERCKDIFNVLIDTYNRFKDNNLLALYHDEIEYLFIENLLLYGQYRFLVLDDYKSLIKKTLAIMNEYFPNYLNNRYFKQLSTKDKFFIRRNNTVTCSLFRKYLLRGNKDVG